MTSRHCIPDPTVVYLQPTLIVLIIGLYLTLCLPTEKMLQVLPCQVQVLEGSVVTVDTNVTKRSVEESLEESSR